MNKKEFLKSVMRLAWQIAKLVKRMKSGIVQFFYMNQNGELRQAFGTTDPSRYEYTPTSSGKKVKDDCIRYWDTVKGGFRMFKKYNLINVL